MNQNEKVASELIKLAKQLTGAEKIVDEDIIEIARKLQRIHGAKATKRKDEILIKTDIYEVTIWKDEKGNIFGDYSLTIRKSPFGFKYDENRFFTGKVGWNDSLTTDQIAENLGNNISNGRTTIDVEDAKFIGKKVNEEIDKKNQEVEKVKNKLMEEVEKVKNEMIKKSGRQIGDWVDKVIRNPKSFS